MNLADTTVRGMVDRLVRAFVDFLANRTVEQYYSAETAARLLDVTERTFHSYVDLYQTTNGKDGIGPKVVLSFKCVRYSATSINRFLASKRAATTSTIELEDDARAAELAAGDESKTRVAV